MASPLGKWLAHVKRVRLPAVLTRPQRPFTLVTGNESCDLDSAACAIATAYFSSLLTQHVSTYIPLLAIPKADFSLRPELTYLLSQTGISADDLVTLDDIRTIDPHRTSVFLVDHNVPRGAVAEKWDGVEGGMKVEGIIDHHDDEAMFVQQQDNMKRYDVQKSGSCASLVTNWIAGTPSSHPVPTDPTSTTDVPALLHANAPEIHGVAQLLISAILIDTANLKSKVTPHDPRAAHFLAQFIPELNLLKFFDSLRDAKNSIDGMSLPDILRRDYKEYSTPLGKLGMSTVNRPVQLLKEQFSSFEEDLRAFIRRRGLCAHVVMTWSFREGEFRRAGMILSERKEVVETYKREGGERFQMHGVDDIDVGGIVEGWTGWVYEQDALQISRKQVAPFMEEIMKRVGGK